MEDAVSIRAVNIRRWGESAYLDFGINTSHSRIPRENTSDLNDI
jgi:hypothetical protein